MTDLAGHVESCIRTKKLFRSGQRILAAVSGGVDSMVLLAVLHRLSAAHRWQLTMAHFNHQLRGAASDADERAVRQAARRLKLPFVAGHGNVKAFARNNGLSKEMAARRLRHDFLAGTAVRLEVSTIALAHHADDQVELFLLRLLRGAGGEGLAGMKWSNPSPSAPGIRLVRPLLDVSKVDLQHFAAEHHIQFREDASNSSLEIQRNRIRHELIPLLMRRYQPALARNVTRTMQIIGAESECVEAIARRWLKGRRTPPFDRLPVAVQRRVIHQQLIGRGLAPDFDLIERLRQKSSQWISVDVDTSALRDTTGAVRWRRSEQKSFSFNPERRRLSLSSQEREVTFAGVKIRWEIADGNGANRVKQRRQVEYFDAGKVGRSICLRRWQPGDRFQPIGTASARKLQDLFTNLKVPRAERHQRVVAVTRRGEVFWVEGLRMAEHFKLDKSTRQRLKWRWKRETDPDLS